MSHFNSFKVESSRSHEWSPRNIDIINLHCLIRTASDKCITTIIDKLELESWRFLLQSYLMFLFCIFLEDDRSRFINANRCLSTHRLILEHIDRVLSQPKRTLKRNLRRHQQYKGNICGEVCIDLLCHCMSFLDQSSRLDASRVNVYFHSAAIAPFAKQHLCINKNVRNIVLQERALKPHELTRSETIDWRVSYRFNKRGDLNPRSRQFRVNMTHLFQSPSTMTLEINTAGGTKDVLEPLELIGIRNVENLKIKPNRTNRIEIKALKHCRGERRRRRRDIIPKKIYHPVPIDIPSEDLHRLKYIECGMNYMQSIWLNVGKTPHQNTTTESALSALDITQCLIESSEIREITFHLHSGFEYIAPIGASPHPIYWLWNIPKLERCQLRMTINSEREFHKKCRVMIEHKMVRSRAKKQRFKTLVVLLNAPHIGCISIFTADIRSLYPNLESLTIHFVNDFMAQSVNVGVTWTLFGSLREIRLQLPTIDYGISLIGYITAAQRGGSGEFRNLEVLHLLKMRDHGMNDSNNRNRVMIDKDSMTDLVKRCCHFLKCRPKGLCSFNVDLYIEDGFHHKSLFNSYFRPHLVLIKALLHLAVRAKDVYDGYLRLNIPLNGEIFVRMARNGKEFDRKWRKGQYVWDSQNKAITGDIVTDLIALQNEIKKLNRMEDKCTVPKRTMLDLPGLQLLRSHQNQLHSKLAQNVLQLVSHQGF